MKKNKTITIQKLILRNMIIAISVAVVGAVLFAYCASYLRSEYLLRISERTNPSLFFTPSKCTTTQEMTEEISTKKDTQLIILNSELQVVGDVGTEYIVPKTQYTNIEFAQLLTEASNTYYPDYQLVLGENGSEEIAVILQGGDFSSYYDSYGKAMNIYYFVMFAGMALIATITVTLFVSSIYHPVRETMSAIQTNIIKTPYDFSTVDSSQVRLAEGKSVLDSYNAMVKNLKEAQTEKEDAVNANKQLVSNLAHDLKSPITILKGYAEVLGTQELTDKERKEYISYIYKSSNDLNNLLNLLFEQVKYGSPDIKMNLVRTDINAILRQSCANYYMLFDNRGFDFNVDIPEEECFVYLDSVHINRVFSNLLQNVLNHNSVPSPVCVSSNVEDGNCVIRFMDDGVGINSDNKEKIFQPFFQEDSSRNKQNSGLGLYVVRQIMLNHEGNIELESSEDFKTIFKLTMKLS